MKLLIAVVVLVLCSVLPVGGDVYTWIDGNGVKHFSNEPPTGGEDAAQQAEIKHSSNQYDKWEEQRKSDQAKMLEQSRSTVETRKKDASAGKRLTKHPGDVVMYTKPTCGYCVQAKIFFAKFDIPYTEYDISADKRSRERFKKLNGNGVPLIFVGETRIPGFNEGLLRRLFGIK